MSLPRSPMIRSLPPPGPDLVAEVACRVEGRGAVDPVVSAASDDAIGSGAAVEPVE
jgi:hypothetical protein